MASKKPKITKQQRDKCEILIYEMFNRLDKSNTNTEYYKELFARLSDDQFYEMFNRPVALRFHQKPFISEPTLDDISISLKFINVPFVEKVYTPHIYEKDGVAIQSKETAVIYIPMKKTKQLQTKKNSMSTDIDQRDMKTGLLVSHDKNGKTSDKEVESLVIANLDNTAMEFSRPKADAMDAKSMMYNTIKTKGMVRNEDIDIDPNDSLAKNLISTYMIGAHIYTNLVNEDYMLPMTIKGSEVKKIEYM